MLWWAKGKILVINKGAFNNYLPLLNITLHALWISKKEIKGLMNSRLGKREKNEEKVRKIFAERNVDCSSELISTRR